MRLLQKLIIVAFFVAGCGQAKLHLTVNSDPEGASIVSSGKSFDSTPVELRYNIPEEIRNGLGVFYPPVITAIWQDGTSLSQDQMRIHLTTDCTYKGILGHHYYHEYTFTKPLPQQERSATIGGIEKKDVEYGSVTINSEPENCEVYAGGHFVGSTPMTLMLPEGIQLIEVRKAGYEAFVRDLRVYPGSTASLKPQLRRRN